MRLEKEYLMDWVEQMAESLVYEIVEQMSGIVLRRSEPWERLSEGMEIDMITGHVSGDFQIELHFFAQRALLMRLTKNMVGYEPDEEEAQEYAMEFFNILCGRPRPRRAFSPRSMTAHRSEGCRGRMRRTKRFI